MLKALTVATNGPEVFVDPNHEALPGRVFSQRFETRPAVVALEPNSLADIRDDVMRVARACGIERRGADLVESMDRRMREIADRAQSTGRRPRVRSAAASR